jgi:hypothetical protein
MIMKARSLMICHLQSGRKSLVKFQVKSYRPKNPGDQWLKSQSGSKVQESRTRSRSEAREDVCLTTSREGEFTLPLPCAPQSLDRLNGVTHISQQVFFTQSADLSVNLFWKTPSQSP